MIPTFNMFKHFTIFIKKEDLNNIYFNMIAPELNYTY